MNEMALSLRWQFERREISENDWAEKMKKKDGRLEVKR